MAAFWQDHDLCHEMEVALTAVRQAGLLCRAVQSEIDLGAASKKDKSPVTIADFASQALICRALGNAFPKDPIIGEEDAKMLQEAGHEEMLARVVAHVAEHLAEHVADASAAEVCEWIDRGKTKTYSDRFWTLDPIDGTKGFLRGQQYAIALALVIDGQIVLAVLGCPNLGPTLGSERGDGSLMVAIAGQGTWQLPLVGEAEPSRVQVSSQQDPTQIRFCESVEAAHSSHSDSARIAAALAIAAEPARLDSQAKYAVVSRGEAEVYLRLPRDSQYQEKIWDHGAGVLCVTEAGGRVTDVPGRELDFSRGHTLSGNSGVIVTNGSLHADVLRAIEKLGIGRFSDKESD